MNRQTESLQIVRHGVKVSVTWSGLLFTWNGNYEQFLLYEPNAR